jgi:hypothetical protein
MKPIIAAIVLVAMMCYSCKKNKELIYQSATDNVYFNFVNTDTVTHTTTRADSVVYSFALSPEKGTDTIFIPVSLSGNRINRDRSFRVAVVDSLTTAIASLHYKLLEDNYIMPADSGATLLPVVLLNTDPVLTDTTVRIQLELVSTSDLDAEFPKLNTFRIIFSNRLEKPVWWNAWISELGVYSRVKHELFIRVSGTTSLPASTSDATLTPRVLYYTRRFKAFLSNPLQWVLDNPDAGYTCVPAGNGNYYFYSITNPDKKYLLELNVADGKYYFRDEHDNRIV